MGVVTAISNDPIFFRLDKRRLNFSLFLSIEFKLKGENQP